MKNRPPGTTAGTLEGLLRDRDTTESLTVLVAERPAGRASVRLHMRQFDGKDVQETIEVARVRLEQLLRDGAKVTEIRAAVAKLVKNRGDYYEYHFTEPTSDESMMQQALTCIQEVMGILEAP